MVKGRITSLGPSSSHGIRIKRGTAQPIAGESGDELGRNDKLLLPSGNRSANLSFFDETQGNRAITGYHAVIRSRQRRGGEYWLPCQVSGGATLSWSQGNSSGCRRVLVRGLGSSSARASGNSIAAAATDVAQTGTIHWATPYLQALVDKKILSGYPGGDLKPDQSVTREEFASMVAAANHYWNLPEIDRTVEFKDLPTDRWSYGAIRLAVKTRFLSGYPDGNFAPTQKIPIEQALVALVGGLGLTNGVVDETVLSTYQDAATISDWARKAVAAAIQAGIVVDPEARMLRPQAEASRAEIATLIYRALNRATTPSGGEAYRLQFDPASDDALELETDFPEVAVVPLQPESTLVQTDSQEDEVQITNLAASIRVDAALLQPEGQSSVFVDSERVDQGQRYTYRRLPAGGDYRGYLSVLSRQEREAIVISEEIQSLLTPNQWAADNLPEAQNIRQVTRQLLKRSPVQSTAESINGIRFQKTIIDLSDPDTLLTVGLARGATYETIYTRKDPTYGSEPFSQMVNRYSGAAVVASGTFFNANTNELYGNTIAAGAWLRYQPWEKRGTALLIGEGNRPQMITLNQTDGAYAPWDQTWFYLSAGPRLLKAGEIALAPRAEGFDAPSLVDTNRADSRAAIGFPEDGRHLCLVTFLNSLSLQQAAQIMQSMGYYEAMNLDGGASTGLAVDGRIVQSPSRNLTHALVVYDASHPAPTSLQAQWNQFQAGYDRLQVPDPSWVPPGNSTGVPDGNYNQRIINAMNDLDKFDSTAGPDGGQNACVWAVNRVLERAGIAPFTDAQGNQINLVSAVEDLLKNSRGTSLTIVKPSPSGNLYDLAQLQPGDLLVAKQQEHMGIYLGNGIIRSNASTQKKFAWDSDLNFTIRNRPDYAGYPSRAYRLIK
jgi:exopolysaccharide biosynthesis protein